MTLSRVRGLCAVALAALVLSACGTPGPIITENVGGLRTGIAATREQARLSFEAANKIAREQAIEHKLDSPAVSIADADFPFAVARSDVEAWATAFGALDSYAGALQKLVDPKRAQATGDALAGLGNQLNSGSFKANIPASVSGAFAAFGSALVQAQAEKTATAAMRRVDPEFQNVIQAMVGGIGDDDSSGLRLTVRSNWAVVQSGVRTAYSTTAPANRDARRKLLLQYAANIDARDAQLANLAQLRGSLLALGEAHAAAARGEPGTAQFWIDRANGWLDDVRKRVAAAEKAEEAAK